MNWNKRNIEDFLREKLSLLQSQPSNDWDIFEQKLRRALWWQRIQLVGGLAALTGIAVFLWQLNISNAPVQQSGVGKQDTLQQEAFYNPLEWMNEAPENEISANPGKPESMALQRNKPSQTNAAVLAHSLRKKPIPYLRANRPEWSLNVQPLSFTPPSRVLEEPIEIPQKNFTLAYESAVNPKHQTGKDEEDDLYVPEPESGNSRMSIIKHTELTNPEDYEYEPYVSPYQSDQDWIYSLNVYPTFTFRKFLVDPEKQLFLHQDFRNAVESAESHGFSMNVGLAVSRRIGKITYLNSGAEFITFNSRATFNFKKFREADVDPATGQIRGYNILEQAEQIQFIDQNYYRYLKFPLSISHQPWASENVKINIQAGASLMCFLGAEGKSIDFKTLEQIDLSERSYQQFIPSFNLRVGARYYVAEDLNIGLEPTFVYFANTIFSEDYPFVVVPYSVGLNFNLQLKLN